MIKMLNKYSVEQIFKLMDKHSDSRTLVLPSGRTARITRTLKTFRRWGISCARCKLKGKFFHEYPVEDNEKDMSKLMLIAVIKTKKGQDKYVLMTADHIIPYSKGGANHLTNLQTMCEDCNYKKQDTLNPDWEMEYSLRSVKEYVLHAFADSSQLKEFVLDFRNMMKAMKKSKKIKDYILCVSFDEMAQYLEYIRTQYGYDVSFDNVRKLPRREEEANGS